MNHSTVSQLLDIIKAPYYKEIMCNINGHMDESYNNGYSKMALFITQCINDQTYENKVDVTQLEIKLYEFYYSLSDDEQEGAMMTYQWSADRFQSISESTIKIYNKDIDLVIKELGEREIGKIYVLCVLYVIEKWLYEIVSMHETSVDELGIVILRLADTPKDALLDIKFSELNADIANARSVKLAYNLLSNESKEL